MSNYKIKKQNNGFWWLDDGKGSSMYLVEGSSRAVLFDTGMSDEPLGELLNSLTDKPVDLILTHAHIDHMYRAGDFENIYINSCEKQCYTGKSQRLMNIGSRVCRVKRKNYPVSGYKEFSHGDILDLGGIKIKAFTLGGHTAGSTVLVVDEHQAVICGDAVGSGAGVWMFLPDSIGIKKYAQQLEKAVEYLKPYETYAFYPGHFEQGFAEAACPVSYDTFCDMLELCRKIESSSAKAAFRKIPLLNLLCFRHNSALIITSKRKMR